jgi:hypothetical protein
MTLDEIKELSELRLQSEMELRAENKRLLAALQHIYGLDIRLTTETVEEIVRKALEG